jgi:hypothetical protein
MARVTIPLNDGAYLAVSERMTREAATRPAEPQPSPLVNCPWCNETTPRHVAQIAGWVRARIGDREVLFSSRSCVTLYSRRALALNKPVAELVADVVAHEPRTWVDTPIGGERRALRVTCATDPRHRIVIDQQLLPDGTWGPDSERLLATAGWLERGGLRYCGATCASRVRAPAAPLVAVQAVDDVSYQRSRARAAAPPMPGLSGREVPDRPQRKGGR